MAGGAITGRVIVGSRVLWQGGLRWQGEGLTPLHSPFTGWVNEEGL